MAGIHGDHWNPNPTGKGGFQERPQDRGHWNKNTSPTYLTRKYILYTLPQLEKMWDDPSLPSLDRIVIKHIIDAIRSDNVATDLYDRLDGRPRQTVQTDLTTHTPPRIIIENRDAGREKNAGKEH